MLVSGEAVCTLLKIKAGAPGNPAIVRWSVSSVEHNAGKKRIRDFNGDKSCFQDFELWLKGKHGFRVARALEIAHAATVQEEAIEGQ